MTLPAAAARLPADIDRYLMPTLRLQQAADADQRDRHTDTHPLHRLCTAYYRPTIYCRPVGRKWNWGCFSCKKVDLSSTQGALCTVSIFLFYILLIWGVRTHPMHPLPAGLYCINQQWFIQCDSSSMNLSTRQANTCSYTVETDAACQRKCTEAVHCWSNG